ncbi:hypothetical protein WJX74_008856 [Apatococcus lobatus]|uniref:EXPERA domain-containing protein n=1 Tax=Apatococcus lobatus TaxID=904363 RepID=A0AAW1R3T7_9CHLO
MATVVNRPFDLLIVGFLLSHIPITVFIDSQAIFPKAWYPGWATKTLDWYLATYEDPLMRDMPPWFMALAANEIFVQLPFFFVGAYAFLTGKHWIRMPALLYGVSTATTLLPILAELLSQPGPHTTILVAFYLPYLIFPAAIAVAMVQKLSNTRQPAKLD